MGLILDLMGRSATLSNPSSVMQEAWQLFKNALEKKMTIKRRGSVHGTSSRALVDKHS